MKPGVHGQIPFNPRQVLLDQLASLKVERSIDAIEKGDEIDLATGEISRELEAKISMRQQRQMKEIQDALERLKQGDYGTCEECGEAIPEPAASSLSGREALRPLPGGSRPLREDERGLQLEGGTLERRIDRPGLFEIIRRVKRRTRVSITDPVPLVF